MEARMKNYTNTARSTAMAAGLCSAVLVALLLSYAAQGAPGGSGYKLIHEMSMPQVTGWDYLSVDPEARRLYIATNAGAIVFDIDAEKVVGNVPDQPLKSGLGLVHGVAVAREFNRGFLSHEVPPSVIIFDLKSLAQLGVTPADPGTDAVVYDPVSKRVFTFNGKKEGVHDASVIDAATSKAAGTIQLPGSPEFPVADGAGHVYVNIEDKSALVQIDSKTLKVTATWPLAPCEEPSGLAIDVAHHRLFAGCHNKLMVMADGDTGKVIATVPIGDGVDANAFDPGTGYAFSSNGEGTLTVAHEDAPDKLSLVEQVKTSPGARTMAVDFKTHRVFLMAGKFGARRPKPSPDNPHGYPQIEAGTAKLLILGR
jgi:DNA-binding beta-propeller fold protein YncE